MLTTTLFCDRVKCVLRGIIRGSTNSTVRIADVATKFNYDEQMCLTALSQLMQEGEIQGKVTGGGVEDGKADARGVIAGSVVFTPQSVIDSQSSKVILIGME
eukprot:GHVN01056632.1.p1 GENE.GHVN01056632.1~~GHVN01056632.1.p1  ORF type:complete len:102 (+),score=13.48 GHVN01056632.1:568-873(+)